MTSKLRALGIALIAVFAISAAFASMASADDLTSETSPVTLTGTGEKEGAGLNKLTFPGVGITSCTTAKYHPTTSTVTPTTTVVVKPTYEGCTSVGFPAVVDMNECEYHLQLGSGSEATTITSEVVCPAGKEITVTANPAATIKCTIHIPPQKLLKKTEVTNIGSLTTREIQFHLEINNITANSTAGTGLGACPTKHTTAAELTGTVNVTGENPANGTHVGIFLS